MAMIKLNVYRTDKGESIVIEPWWENILEFYRTEFDGLSRQGFVNTMNSSKNLGEGCTLFFHLGSGFSIEFGNTEDMTAFMLRWG
jgi:hypothetical protein